MVPLPLDSHTQTTHSNIPDACWIPVTMASTIMIRSIFTRILRHHCITENNIWMRYHLRPRKKISGASSLITNWHNPTMRIYFPSSLPMYYTCSFKVRDWKSLNFLSEYNFWAYTYTKSRGDSLLSLLWNRVRLTASLFWKASFPPFCRESRKGLGQASHYAFMYMTY